MKVTCCRVCRGMTFAEVLDLGLTPFADDFVPAGRADVSETYYPLRVLSCLSCGLVQLSYVAPREALYGEDYPYVSSTTASGVMHYRRMAAEVYQRVQPPQGGLAVDIGSNVGVLLDGFRDCGQRVLGIEPVPYIAKTANARGIQTLNEFFSARLASEVMAQHGRAHVVTGTNVVAHIDNLWDLANGLRTLLAPSGMFVFEAPYLGDLLENVEYDTIYHEHLSYLSLKPVMRLFALVDMEVVDVEQQDIHGGTMRYYIARSGSFKVSDAVTQLAASEPKRCGQSALSAFAAKVRENRLMLGHMIRTLRLHDRSVAAVSAPAKGMTLLHACGLGPNLIDFVTEKAPTKIGKFTPGTRIPVLADEELLRRQPDYALLLAWNFAKEIMHNLREYRGAFIVPVPRPQIWFRTDDGQFTQAAAGAQL